METAVTKEAFKVVEEILDELDVSSVENDLAAYGSFDLSDPMQIAKKKQVVLIADRFKRLVSSFSALNSNREMLSAFVEETQFTANKVKVDLIDECFNKLLNFKMALNRFFDRRPSKEGWSLLSNEINKLDIKARVMWTKEHNKIYWKW